MGPCNRRVLWQHSQAQSQPGCLFPELDLPIAWHRMQVALVLALDVFLRIEVVIGTTLQVSQVVLPPAA